MERIGEVLVQVSADRIGRHIAELEGVRHPAAAPEALERAAGYISRTLSGLGYQMSEQLFDDNGRPYRNLIATSPGLSHPEQRVLVIAHYDTVEESPGADDNASGVAVLLELARVLAGFRFERTLQLIAVNLEENASESGTGLRGSRALAAHARQQGWHLEGVLVLESVAYAGDDVIQDFPAGLPVPAPKVGNFIALVGNEASRDLVGRLVAAIADNGIDLPTLPLVLPGNGELLPDSRRSDHAPFWDQGYKALMITDTTNFRSPHYHQPSDTLDTLNLAFAAKVCQATLAAVLELAQRGLAP